ncbi:hypothetical protein [Clostridium perfringens]|uniref:hypothetical protein n=1 Tax=Clostridium perfringens TaxID=1502 RepID=UPI0034A2ED56
MQSIENRIDEYILDSAINRKDPVSLDVCDSCGEEIFEGEVAVADDDKHLFCCHSCAIEKHQLREVTTFGICPEGNCEECGIPLEAEEYEVYSIAEGKFFCSEACAESYLGFENVYMEGKY